MVHATALLHRHILLGRPPECCRLQFYSLLPCGLVDHICSSLLYILFLCRLPFFLSSYFTVMFISASQGLEIMFFLFFHFFHFDHHFFGLKIIISFLSPLSFFIIFSFLFFLPLAFSFFFPLLRKWSLVLGNCHQRLFLEPFSSVFSIAFAL